MSQTNNFNIFLKTKIAFGKNSIEQLGDLLVENKATNVLIVYGKSSIKKIGLYDKVIESLKSKKINYFECFGVVPNPLVDKCREGIQTAIKNNVDFILAVGGGSVIDSAKCIAAGIPYCKKDPKNDVWEMWAETEKIGFKVPVTEATPLATILTLSATGSEADAGAVISNLKVKQKNATISDPILRPVFSILDPCYTYTVSKKQTQAGSVDIMSHILEQYFSVKSMDLLDTIAEGLLKTVIKWMPVAIKNPNDYEARANLMYASSLALNGLIGSSRGFTAAWEVHSIEHKCSAFFPNLTHGIGLAIITPGVLKGYLENEKVIPKLCRFGKNVFNIDGEVSKETGLKAIEALEKFWISQGVPTRFSELKDQGIVIDKTACKEIAKHFIKTDGKIGIHKKLGEKEIEELLISRI